MTRDSAAQHRRAADCLQRPLLRRSRFRQQLTPSVCYDFRCQGLPADVFRSSCFFSPRCIGKDGASNRRRLILLLSVGWLPPYLPPSGACLSLGSSVLDEPLNAAEGYTKPGLRLFRCTVEPVRVARFSGSCLITSRRRCRRPVVPPWQGPTESRSTHGRWRR
jgi:hypothetical protein